MRMMIIIIVCIISLRCADCGLVLKRPPSEKHVSVVPISHMVASTLGMLQFLMIETTEMRLPQLSSEEGCCCAPHSGATQPKMGQGTVQSHNEKLHNHIMDAPKYRLNIQGGTITNMHRKKWMCTRFKPSFHIIRPCHLLASQSGGTQEHDDFPLSVLLVPLRVDLSTLGIIWCCLNIG